MQNYQQTIENNATHSIQSLGTINDFHFYDHESKILIHSSGKEIKIPENRFYDLSNIEQAEEYLINLGLINEHDCLISYYEDEAA